MLYYVLEAVVIIAVCVAGCFFRIFKLQEKRRDYYWKC